MTEKWSLLKKLIWLRGAGIIGAVWQTITNAAVASFTAVAAALRELVIDVTPVQSGSGDPSPTNVRPVSGWTGANVFVRGINLWDEITEIGTFNSDGSEAPSTNTLRTKNHIPIRGGTGFRFVSPYNAPFYFYRADKSFISAVNVLPGSTQTAPDDAAFFRFRLNSSYGTAYNHDVSVNYPAADTAYHAYSGSACPVSWESEAGTVYGGTLSDNGDGTWTLTVTWAGVDLAALTWTPDAEHGTFSSANLRTGSAYKYIQQINTNMSASVVARVEKYDPISLNNMTASYPDNSFAITTIGNILVKADASPSGFLAYQIKNGQPLPEYTLTAGSVRALIGRNNLFADCGNINTVTYRES